MRNYYEDAYRLLDVTLKGIDVFFSQKVENAEDDDAAREARVDHENALKAVGAAIKAATGDLALSVRVAQETRRVRDVYDIEERLRKEWEEFIGLEDREG